MFYLRNQDERLTKVVVSLNTLEVISVELYDPESRPELLLLCPKAIKVCKSIEDWMIRQDIHDYNNTAIAPGADSKVMDPNDMLVSIVFYRYILPDLKPYYDLIFK